MIYSLDSSFRGKSDEALITVLKNAPFSVKNRNPQIKVSTHSYNSSYLYHSLDTNLIFLQEKALRLMMKVMLSIKSSQIDEVIQRLDIEQVDTLMKYVYKGFENPTEGSSAHLLVWHEKAFAIGGLGCIVRVLTDNKRV